MLRLRKNVEYQALDNNLIRDLKMSRAKASFDYGIKDAEELLAFFDEINIKPPPPNAEVLKRAGLVMALTAWETYVVAGQLN